MSFIYSRALVEAFSPASCSDTVASVPSNGSPTPKPCLWHDKTMEPSRLSRFGMTCAHLMDARGAELLTSFAAASRVKTSASQGGVMALMASDPASGPKWQGSFARYSPESSSWKTAQCSLLEDSDEFLETWPRWGSMRNGASYLRPMPALRICESASGLWPTPTVCGNYNRPGASATSGMGLATAVKMWPTPCASASKGSSPASLTRKDGRSRANDRIDHAVMSSDGGPLNPEWLEWLMGWPIGFTGLKPLATGRFLEWQRQHSPSCQGESEVAA